MVRWGEQTFEEMMIGYLDMDVPVGSPIIRSNDFRPAQREGDHQRSPIDAEDVQAKSGSHRQVRIVRRRKMPSHDPSSSLCARCFSASLRPMAQASLASAADDSPNTREIPAAFAPFEYLIGAWKGQGMPKESAPQQFRGWDRKTRLGVGLHQGKADRPFLHHRRGQGRGLRQDDASTQRRSCYHLEGKAPDSRGTPIAFEGKLDSTGKLLVFDRVARQGKARQPTAGEMRITLRPNANFVRYTMTQDQKPAGRPCFRGTLEVGVTKEGETFAAGAADN